MTATAGGSLARRRAIRRQGPAGVLAPSAHDPVVRAASELVGGPAGNRLASATGVLRAIPVLVLLGMITLGAGIVSKEHCRTEGWRTPDQFWHACYSDVGVLYSSAGLGGPDRAGLVEAVSGHLGQPPLLGAAMWAVAGLSGSGVPASSPDGPRRFFDVSALVLAACLATAIAAVASATGRRRWDASHLALSPVIVTAGLISYDLLAVALLALSILAWARARPLLGGVVLGLATATRPVTSAVAIAVVGVALRDRRAGAGLTYAGSALAGWLAVRVLLLPGLTGGIAGAWQSWKAAGPGYGSIWLVPQLLAASRPRRARWWYTRGALSPSVTTALVLVAVVLLVACVLVLVMTPRHRPRLAHVALFAAAGGLLVSKSFPPQASLVLLPLIALAGLPWRDQLIWAMPELAYFVGVWLYIAGSSDPNRGLPAPVYMCLLLARLAAVAWLGAQAVRAARDPLIDPVRMPEDGAAGVDDPLLAARA